MPPLRSLLGYVLVGLALLCSTACTITRPIAKGATQHNRAVHDSINRTLLLNILRAADREPKTFTSVSAITGKGSASPTPSVSLGLSTDASDKLSLPFPLNGSTSAFTTEVHDSKEFAQGLFDPLSMDQLLHFWNQGWSRTMLLLLAVSSVEVTEVPCHRLRELGLPDLQDVKEFSDSGDERVVGCKARYWNRARDGLAEVSAFATAISLLVQGDRVSIEPATTFSVELPVKTLTDLDKLAALAEKPGYSLERADMGGESRASDDGTPFVLSHQTPTFFLALGRDPSERVPFGGSLKQGGSTLSVSGSIRSTEGLIHYIGQIHRYQSTTSPLVITDPDPGSSPDQSACQSRVLFEIANARMPHDEALVSVKHRGEPYSIRLATRADVCPPMTGTVMSFLRQAFALNSSDTDTPSPGLVLVGVDG